MSRQRLPMDPRAGHLNSRQLAVRGMWQRRRAEGLEPPEGAAARLKNERRRVASAERSRRLAQAPPPPGTANTPIQPRGRARVRQEDYTLPAELVGPLRWAEGQHLAGLPLAAQPVAGDLMHELKAALLRAAGGL